MATTVVELQAILKAQAAQFLKPVEDARKALGELDVSWQKVEKTGKEATTKLTLPLLAAGAAAIKLSTDFDRSMNKLVGLVGLSSAEVAELKGQVLSLAGETAVAPQELADALFFVESSGLRGAAAMEALEYAAKASAAGLGEAKDIALVAAAATNAYGAEVMNAALATDVLAGTARAGNFEVAELSSSIGQVLPIAASANVELDQLGGAVALLTRSGSGASESVTQIKAAILAMNAPTAEAKDLLDGYRGGAEELAQILAGPNGLVEGFRFVEGAAGGDASAMRLLLGSQEALNAGLTILSASNEELDATFGAVANSAGLTDAAFQAASQTAGFKMQQAWTKMQVALIKLGDVIVPMAASVAGVLAAIADGFSSLPVPVQKVIALFGGLAAAVGPVMVITAKVVTSYQQLTAAWAKNVAEGGAMSSTLSRVANSAQGAATVAAAGAAVWASYQAMMANARKEGEDFAAGVAENMSATTFSYDDFVAANEEVFSKLHQTADAFHEANNANVLSRAANRDYIASMNEAAAGLEDLGAKNNKMTLQMQALADKYGITKDRAAEFIQVQAAAGTEFATSSEAMAAYEASTGRYAGAVDELGSEFAGTEADISAAHDALTAWSDAVNAQFDPMFSMISSQQAAADATAAIEAAQIRLNEAWASGDTAAAAEASRALDAANVDLLKTNIDLDIAARELALAVASGQTPIEDLKAAIDGYADSGRIGADAAATLKGKLDEATFAALVLDAQSPLVNVTADTSQFDSAMASARLQAANLATMLAGGLVAMPDGRAMGAVTGQRATNNARGSVVRSPTLSWLGEAGGDEVVLPLNDKGRMAALLADVIGGGSPAALTGGASSGGGGGITVINQGRATAEDGAAIVDAISAYERRNGAGWRGA